MMVPFVTVAYYVVKHGNEFGWLQEAEILVNNQLFGLSRCCYNR